MRPSFLLHSNTQLTPFLSSRLCVQPLSLHLNQLLTLLFSPIFDSSGSVRLSFLLQLIPLLTPLLSPRLCVCLLSCIHIHSSLHFHPAGGMSIAFLAIKSTAYRPLVCASFLFLALKFAAHSIFVCQFVHLSPFLAIHIHCLVHFRMAVCGFIPFLALKSTAYFVFFSQSVDASLLSCSNPVLTPSLSIFDL